MDRLEFKDGKWYLVGNNGNLLLSAKEVEELNELIENSNKYKELLKKVIYIDSLDKELAVIVVKDINKEIDKEIINSMWRGDMEKSLEEKHKDSDNVDICLKRILEDRGYEQKEKNEKEIKSYSEVESAKEAYRYVLNIISVNTMETIKELEKNNDEETNNRCIGKLFAYAEEFEMVLKLLRKVK